MIDTNNSTWLTVKKHAEDKLGVARMNLEMQGIAPAAADFERGRIKALKDILALADPGPNIPESAPFN